MCRRGARSANRVAPAHVGQDEKFQPCGTNLAHRIDDGNDLESLPNTSYLGNSLRILCSGIYGRHRNEREIDALTRMLRMLRWRVDERRVPPFRFRLANKFKLFSSRLSNSGDAFADAPNKTNISLLLASEIIKDSMEASGLRQLVSQARSTVRERVEYSVPGMSTSIDEEGEGDMPFRPLQRVGREAATGSNAEQSFPQVAILV